jgi:antitoxin ParD1/3/4
MQNTPLNIGEHFSAFIEAKIAEGRYGSASEVVRAALRLLEEKEAELEALRAALIEGETSGASAPFDFDEFLAGKRSRSNARRSAGKVPRERKRSPYDGEPSFRLLRAPR